MAEIIRRYTNYLWQEEPRKPYYRIQTNDHRIARKLNRKAMKSQGSNPNRVVQVGFGIDKPIWIFQIQFKSPHIAKKSFARITGASVEESVEKGVFAAYTLPPRTITLDPEPMIVFRGDEDEL